MIKLGKLLKAVITKLAGIEKTVNGPIITGGKRGNIVPAVKGPGSGVRGDDVSAGVHPVIHLDEKTVVPGGTGKTPRNNNSQIAIKNYAGDTPLENQKDNQFAWVSKPMQMDTLEPPSMDANNQALVTRTLAAHKRNVDEVAKGAAPPSPDLDVIKGLNQFAPLLGQHNDSRFGTNVSFRKFVEDTNKLDRSHPEFQSRMNVINNMLAGQKSKEIAPSLVIKPEQAGQETGEFYDKLNVLPHMNDIEAGSDVINTMIRPGHKPSPATMEKIRAAAQAEGVDPEEYLAQVQAFHKQYDPHNISELDKMYGKIMGMKG